MVDCMLSYYTTVTPLTHDLKAYFVEWTYTLTGNYRATEQIKIHLNLNKNRSVKQGESLVFAIESDRGMPLSFCSAFFAGSKVEAEYPIVEIQIFVISPYLRENEILKTSIGLVATNKKRSRNICNE